MTDTSPHPPGLVTDEEAEILTDPDTDLDEHGELRARLKTRLTETVHDFSLLYPTLPADDLAAVFASDADDDLASIRTGTQDGLALLVLGMLLGDDMIEMRLQDAIQNAGLSYGEDIDVTLALRRGPLKQSWRRFLQISWQIDVLNGDKIDTVSRELRWLVNIELTYCNTNRIYCKSSALRRLNPRSSASWDPVRKTSILPVDLLNKVYSAF